MSTPGLENVRLHLVDSIDDAAELKRWLGERREVLAIDTETSGLDWTRDRVRLIQIGDENTGWAIPWDLWGGVAIECIERYEGRIVMHNAKFDTHMLESSCELTIPRHLIDDTMVMAHILDSTRSVALKTLTTHLIDPKAAAAQRVLDEGMASNGWTWATVPLSYQPYWAYGALDTVLTARLWSLMRPQVLASAPAAYDLEMGRTWVVQRQERNGCHVDIDYTQARYDEFMEYVERAADWCQSQYGVSPGSDAKIIERLRADGIEFTKMTSSGSRFALDKEVLESIIATTNHPLAATVLQRRRLLKLANTYLRNFIDMVDDDSLLHPNVRVLGARTSRESISEPALQTLPRKSERNPAANTVRNCITARAEDRTLLMCDFEQVEMRMFAHLSQDPGLIAAFGDGDFFLNVARELYADDTMTKDDPRRQFTKNGMYALGYGAGADKIAQTTGRPIEAVHDFLNLLGRRFPGIRNLQREVSRVALERKAAEGVPYVRSPLTGRRHIADEGKEYALVNYLIQSTAAEVFKMKTIELANAGLDEYLILGVHDEVVLDVPLDVLDDVAPLVKSIMEDDQLFTVPLTADVSTAYRWGAA